MADESICPTCGWAHPAAIPCRPVPPGETVVLGPGGVLDDLAATIGPIEPVALRDLPASGGGAAPGLEPERAVRAGRFALRGEIARGGMGAVLQGRDEDLNRDLAIKVLLEEHAANPALLRQFVEEAQIAGQLHHPGVVPIYELGALADRRPYIAMKLVRGRTLAAILADRDAADPARARPLAIFLDVAQAMAYAHARGVIHCDLKPANIMVGSFGEVQVMDWGLARVVDRDAGPGREAVITSRPVAAAGDGSGLPTVLGTPGYMAPEQARGDVAGVDPRADVFALGSILCEILTGRPAYTGWSLGEVLRRAARADLADARAALDRSDADAELVALARAALAPDRDARPADAGAIADALNAHLAGARAKLQAAERAGAAAEARATEEAKRRRLTVALAASLLATAGLAGGGWSWIEARRAGRRAEVGRAVDGALAEAAGLRGRSRANPDGDPNLLDLALAEARRGAALLAQGEGDPEREDRVRATLDALGRERRAVGEHAEAIEADRRLVARLDEIHAGFGVHLDRERMDREYASAFRDAGIDVVALPPPEAAARIVGRPIAPALVEALDQWSFCRQSLPPSAKRADPGGVDRLIAVADAADPDPGRVELRAATARGDRDELRRVANELDLDRVPKESASRLAYRLHYEADDPAGAVRILRGLAVRHRDDFWLAHDLGDALLAMNPPEVDEALRYATAAAALQPRSRFAADLLARALGRKGRVAELTEAAAVAARRAPDAPSAHFAVATAHRAARRFDEAIAEYRRATELDPRFAAGFLEWGGVYWDQGRFGGAIGPWRQYLRLAPGDRRMRNNQAFALLQVGRPADAAAEARAATRLDPADPRSQQLLGAALMQLRDWAGSIAASRAALALRPDPQVYLNLAQALEGRGDFPAAASALRDARALVHAPGAAPNAGRDRLIDQAERRVAAAARLPAYLRGGDPPAAAADRIALAETCYARGLHAAAARLYAATLDDPAAALPPETPDHYNAACSAALAGTGGDRGDRPPGDADRARLRRQALAWLRVGLGERARVLDADPAGAAGPTSRLLAHWGDDADLAGVRDPAAIGRLPADEQAAWSALWADVTALRARAERAEPAPAPAGG